MDFVYSQNFPVFRVDLDAPPEERWKEIASKMKPLV